MIYDGGMGKDTHPDFGGARRIRSAVLHVEYAARSRRYRLSRRIVSDGYKSGSYQL